MCVIFQPFFVAITTMFMLRHRPDFDPVYVVVGAALSGIWSIVLFEGNWIIGGERGAGTLEYLVGAPTSFMLVIGSRLVGTIVFSLLSMVLCWVIGAWLFGYAITIAEPGAFVVSTLLALVALWATGLVLAPLGIMWRTVSTFLTVLEYPVYALSGFLFPILLMPDWSRGVSVLLPPYWAALALHGTSSGDPSSLPISAVWGLLLLSAGAAVAVAWLLFRLVQRRARAQGTLALT
jgi:ABC-2 type transport system permease protein